MVYYIRSNYGIVTVCYLYYIICLDIILTRTVLSILFFLCYHDADVFLVFVAGTMPANVLRLR